MYTNSILRTIFLVSILALCSEVATMGQVQVVATSTPAVTEPGQQLTPDGPHLSDQVNQLRTKVEQLELLIEKQQHVVAELQKRISDSDARMQATLAATAETSKGTPEARIVNASLDSNKSQSSTPPQAAQPKETKAVLLAGWDDNHAFLKSADGWFQTFLTGYAQLDFRGYQSGNHPPNTFLVRSRR